MFEILWDTCMRFLKVGISYFYLYLHICWTLRDWSGHFLIFKLNLSSTKKTSYKIKDTLIYFPTGNLPHEIQCGLT